MMEAEHILGPEQVESLNAWESFFSFRPNHILRLLLQSHAPVTALFTGNQAGKNANVAYSYILRILGKHPIPEKNMRPDQRYRIIRFASESLPHAGGDQSGEGEVKNTQYPEFRRWLPYELMKKDITERKPVMTVRDPLGGPDIYIEFVSYNQPLQTQAGVKRWSVWMDEEPTKDFFDEQVPRLLLSGGDIVLTLTAVNGLSWVFDDIFERAGLILRTPTMARHLHAEEREEVAGKKDITVVMAATDDNPMLTPAQIESQFAFLDEETMAVRRYGLFMQTMGRIFREFSTLHLYNDQRLFPNSYPPNWFFARGIDYHPHLPWAIGWAALSPENEMFVWRDWSADPSKMVTRDIAEQVAVRSGAYRYRLDLIDPLARQSQPVTNTSVLEDLNDYARVLKNQGAGTGAFWQPWDTHSTLGRERLRARLHGSKLCERPFNNQRTEGGKVTHIPTLWIADTCLDTIESMRNWKVKLWKTKEAEQENDKKDEPTKKWSHFNMVWEGLLKHADFRPPVLYPLSRRRAPSYFHAGVR